MLVRVQSKVIKNGRLDIEAVIVDEGGDIVALSHHIAYAVPVARNIAVRRTGSTKL